MSSDKIDPSAVHLAIHAVQLEVLSRLRSGARLAQAHKEGGEAFFHEHGGFVLSTYGDSGTTRETFADEQVVLERIWALWRWRTSSDLDGSPAAELTAWQRILQHLVPDDAHRAGRLGPTADEQKAAAFQRRFTSLKATVAMGVGLVVLLGALGWQVVAPWLLTRGTGYPLGMAVGTPEFVAQLVARQVPYLPTLNRNPDADRFDIMLLIEQRDSSAARRLIPVASAFTASETLHGASLLGFDGQQLWVLARSLHRWQPGADRLTGVEELNRVNPMLGTLWSQGSFDVEGQLIAHTRDQRTIVAIDPVTLRARHLPRLPPRQLPLSPDPVGSMQQELPMDGGDTIKPAWIRAAADAPPITLDDPPSRLRTYWKKQAFPRRMLMIERVSEDGKVIWSRETGIDNLQQILPDATVTGFIGTRPAVPDRVPEPILVLVRVDSGAVEQRPLWITE